MNRSTTVGALVDDIPFGLVASDGTVTPITGEVYRSSTMGGAVAIEIALGTLYLDDNEVVTVTDEPPVSVAEAALAEAVGHIRTLMENPLVREGEELDAMSTAAVVLDVVMPSDGPSAYQQIVAALESPSPAPAHSHWDRPDDEYPVEDWQYAVANGDTRLGFWEWRRSERDANEDAS